MTIDNVVKKVGMAAAAVAFAVGMTGCVRNYTKEKPDYSELRRIESQPGYKTDFWQRKCPETTPPQYCHPKRH